MMARPSFFKIKEEALSVIEKGTQSFKTQVNWGTSKNPERVAAGLSDASASGEWGPAVGARRDRRVEWRIEGYVNVQLHGGTQKEATKKANEIFEAIDIEFLKPENLTLNGLTQAVRVDLTNVVEFPIDKGHATEYQFDLIIPVVITR